MEAALLRAFGKRVSYTSILLGGTGVALAAYAAKRVLILQLNNWGFETIICAAAPRGTDRGRDPTRRALAASARDQAHRPTAANARSAAA